MVKVGGGTVTPPPAPELLEALSLEEMLQVASRLETLAIDRHAEDILDDSTVNGDARSDSKVATSDIVVKGPIVDPSDPREARAARFEREAIEKAKYAPPKKVMAHPGGKVVSNKDEATRKFLARRLASGATLTADQQRALEALGGVDGNGSLDGNGVEKNSSSKGGISGGGDSTAGKPMTHSDEALALAAGRPPPPFDIREVPGRGLAAFSRRSYAEVYFMERGLNRST